MFTLQPSKLRVQEPYNRTLVVHPFGPDRRTFNSQCMSTLLYWADSERIRLIGCRFMHSRAESGRSGSYRHSFDFDTSLGVLRLGNNKSEVGSKPQQTICDCTWTLSTRVSFSSFGQWDYVRVIHTSWSSLCGTLCTYFLF